MESIKTVGKCAVDAVVRGRGNWRGGRRSSSVLLITGVNNEPVIK